MKKFRTAAILAVVMFALGGLATWDEWQSKKDEEAAKGKNRLTEAKPEEVVEVEYFSKSSSEEAEEAGEAAAAAKPQEQPVALTLSKKDGVWRVVKPVETLADEQAVNSLIKTVVEYAYGKVVAESKDKWADFGLVDPQRAITLKFADGGHAPLSLYVGDKAPVGFNAYVRTSQGDKTYMGSQYVLTSTAKSLFDLRDKTVAKIDTAAVKSLTYEKSGEAPIEVSKGEGGKFIITKPRALDADPAEARNFLEDISAVRATGFDDQPSAELIAAFASPAYKITWQNESGQATTLLVALHGGKLMAAFDPAKRVMTLPDEMKAKLDRDLTYFRNRRVLAVDASELGTLDVDGTTYKLVHGDWYAAADAEKLDENGKLKTGDEKDKPKEKAHVRAFVVDLEFAKTDRFIDLGAPEAQKVLAEAPEHKVTVGFKTADTPQVIIELFKADDAADKYLVRRSGAPALYRIAKSAFASMTPGSGGDASPAGVGADGDIKPSEGEGGMDFDLENSLEAPGEMPVSGDTGTG